MGRGYSLASSFSFYFRLTIVIVSYLLLVTKTKKDWKEKSTFLTTTFNLILFDVHYSICIRRRYMIIINEKSECIA